MASKKKAAAKKAPARKKAPKPRPAVKTADEIEGALKIEYRRIEALQPYANNARTHSKKQIEQIADSLEEFGWTNPVLLDGDSIVAGHGRILAAPVVWEDRGGQIARTEYGWIPTVQIGGLTPEQKRAYILADNKLAENAGWDRELLRIELGALRDEAFDLGVIGFSDKELDSLFSLKTADDKDDGPVQDLGPTVTKPGDVWILGKHKLICGDSTDPEVLKALLGRERADLVHTDPPYGVSYESQSGKHEKIAGDDARQDDLMAKLLVPAFRNCVNFAHKDAAFYIWHASSTRRDFEDAMRMVGLVERQYLIWAKPAAVLGHADYQWSHEPCFYAAKDDGSPVWYGDRKETTVWRAVTKQDGKLITTLGKGLVVLDGEGGKIFIAAKEPKNGKFREVRIAEGQALELHGGGAASADLWEIARDKGSDIHPTAKPVEIPLRAIMNSSQRDAIVLDVFGGSGSTLIAAEVSGRKARLVELGPRYCDSIVKRWQAVAKQSAILQGSGDATYDEVAAERGAKRAKK